MHSVELKYGKAAIPLDLADETRVLTIKEPAGAIDPETFGVRILDYVVVHDCGTILNPLIVEGQIHGGLAHGIGQALWENAVYDEQGQLLTATLLDYAMPRAHQLVSFELDQTVTPSPHNPLGVLWRAPANRHWRIS